MHLKKYLCGSVSIILGVIILTGMLALMGGARSLNAATEDVQAQPIADIAWNQIYAGKLDGTVYDDLYWGGGTGNRGALVDIDNDNDLDLFFIAGWDPGMDRMHFYRNDGNASAASWTSVSHNYLDLHFGGSLTPSFVDLDADGDKDLVIGEGYQGQLSYYENTGTAGTPQWTFVTHTYADLPTVNDFSPHQTFVDIDGDNDLDMFMDHQVNSEEWSISFYRNDGTAVSASWTFVTDSYADITITNTWALEPTFADIDGDNDPDMFLGKSESVIYFRNDGNATNASWTFVTNEYAGIAHAAFDQLQPIFGDLDGDLALDMLYSVGGKIIEYENTGTSSSASWALKTDGLIPLHVGYYSNPALADIDADGDLDMFLGSAGDGGSKLHFLRNDGTAGAPEWTYITDQYGSITHNGAMFPTFVDINADGRIDMFVGAEQFFSPGVGTVRYYQNIGTPQIAAWTLISDTFAGIDMENRAIPNFADIDGDGDQDMFVTTEGRHAFYRNAGNATTPDFVLENPSFAGIGGDALAFGDVDGDGDLDMFTDSAFYRNDGDATSPLWTPVDPGGNFRSYGESLVLGDVLGNDNRPDIVMGGYGGLWVFENLGDMPPQVSATAPSAGGTGLQTSAIIATFDNIMDGNTMTSANVTVQGSTSGMMAGTLSYNAANRQVVFIPQGKFTEGETVQVTLKAGITDATGHTLDGNGNGIEEGSPTDDAVWTYTVEERDYLVVGQDPEPQTLYWYDGGTLTGSNFFRSIYDGPISNRSYGYQAVILKKLPTLDDGDAVIKTTSVVAGDWIVDTDNQVVTLALGTQVRPAGCRSSDCAITYTGAPLQMDQLEVTFELLPGIQWSDGVTLTADDSVYGYEIHQDPFTSAGGDFPPTDDQLEHTASYVALDTLRTRWTALPGYMDSRYQIMFWHPLPRHAWGHLTAEELHTSPLSTQTPLGWGPYAIDTWTPGVAITLTANPYYYRAGEGLPKIDTLVFRFVGNDPVVSLARVVAGELDAIATDDSVMDTMLDFEGLGVLNAHFRNSAVWEHADFAVDPRDNYVRPDFFEDVEMRRAVAYCLDRQEMVDETMYGYVEVLNTYIPQEHPLYPGDDALMIYQHNIVSGTALLEGLGWTDTNGDGIRECRSCSTAGASEGDLLTFNWLSTVNPLREAYMKIAQQNLGECGIALVRENTNVAWGPIFSREYDMGSFAWVSDYEPSCNLYLSSQIPSDENGWNGNNNTGWSNASFDIACNAALSSLPGTEEYTTNHQEAMRILSEELPALPLFSRLRVGATHPRLIGYRLDATSWSALDNVEEWEFIADALPPVGSIVAGDGSQAQNITPVTLHLAAMDNGGGTVVQMFLRERAWNGTDWAVVAETGWIPYVTTKGWDLDPTPGAHYLSAYFMDDSGNASILPARTVLNLTPASGDLLEDEIDVYRVRVDAGETFTATLTTHSGDADLYIWEPGSEAEPDIYSNLDGTLLDQVVVTGTIAGDYHIEARGYAPASAYHLSLDVPVQTTAGERRVLNSAFALNVKEIPQEPLSVDVPDDTPAEAPGGIPSAMSLTAPFSALMLSGKSVQVTGYVWDQQSDAVTDGTPVTFTTSLGVFAASGTMTDTMHTVDGYARVTLVTGNVAGPAEVTARAGEAQAVLGFTFNWPYTTYLPVVLRLAP